MWVTCSRGIRGNIRRSILLCTHIYIYIYGLGPYSFRFGNQAEKNQKNIYKNIYQNIAKYLEYFCIYLDIFGYILEFFRPGYGTEKNTKIYPNIYKYIQDIQDIYKIPGGGQAAGPEPRARAGPCGSGPGRATAAWANILILGCWQPLTRMLQGQHPNFRMLAAID